MDIEKQQLLINPSGAFGELQTALNIDQGCGGLALLVAPTLIIGLLLGNGLGATGVAVARVLGIGLLSVGVAAWESPQQHSRLAPRAGLCMYNIGITVVLAILGTTGGVHAPLLWPVAGLHGMIGAAMLWVIFAYLRNISKI